MTLRRYALGHFRIFESGRVHATAWKHSHGYSVQLIITESRRADVVLSGYGYASTCAEAFKVARAALAAPVTPDATPVMTQLGLFADAAPAGAEGETC